MVINGPGFGPNDKDHARTLRPLQAAACTYRIAFGPRVGQKVLTLQGAMPREPGFKQSLCANEGGFRFGASCQRLLPGDEFHWPNASMGSRVQVRHFRMQPFSCRRRQGARLPTRMTTATWLSFAPRLRRTSSSEVDPSFAESVAKVCYRQPASFGRPKSNVSSQSGPDRQNAFLGASDAACAVCRSRDLNSRSRTYSCHPGSRDLSGPMAGFKVQLP